MKNSGKTSRKAPATVPATMLRLDPETLKWLDSFASTYRTILNVNFGRTTIARAVLAGLRNAGDGVEVFGYSRSEFEIQDRVCDLIKRGLEHRKDELRFWGGIA